MKNIAFYYESSEATGGVNRVASHIASALADCGYRVHIISRYEGLKGRFTSDSRIVWHELFRTYHSKYFTWLLEIVRLRRLVQRERIDVLISAGGVFFALARFAQAKHIEWDHVSFWHGNKLQQYCRVLAARKASAVVTLTKDNSEAYSAIEGCNAKVVTIHNPAVTTASVVSNLSNKRVISVGFLARQKGYDLLLQAWSLLDVRLRSEWELWIAGGDEGDGTMLERMIREHDMREVKLLGFRSDVGDLMAHSSIYVMSSRWEGMPMVLLEAQAYGLPVVSFDCKTGPAEVLSSDSGILVAPENPIALSEALAGLMRDEEHRHRMSESALRNIKRFSLNRIVQQWVQLIESL